MKKRIVLCADDYGQASAISNAILSLIRQNCLSATSCLVNTPYWREHGAWLTPYQAQVDIGLHVNLTEGTPLSKAFKNKYGETFFPLKQLLLRSSLRLLDQKIIADEIMAQINAFTMMMGFLPHFIDGHQHVHQFPIVRDALFSCYQQLALENIYIRWINEKLKFQFSKKYVKQKLIHSMGTKAFKHLLMINAIPHNQSFAGIYLFNEQDDYGQLFADFLEQIDDGGIILCHPANNPKMELDPLANIRYKEYLYLASDLFKKECKKHDVTLAKFLNISQ